MRRKNLEDALLAFFIFALFCFGFFLTLQSELATKFFTDFFDNFKGSETRIIIETK